MTGRLALDLTGPRSHVLTRRQGDSGLTIGTDRCDLIVGPDDVVHWNALDVPELVADGFPTRLRYEGSDPEVGAWATRRGLGNLHLIATRAVELDLSPSSLQYMTIEPCGHAVVLHLPSSLSYVVIEGDPADVAIVLAPDGIVPGVILHMPRIAAPSSGTDGARRPSFPPPLLDARVVRIYGHPFDPPFDARVLRDFPRIEAVEVRGAVANLDALAGLGLTSLEFRFVPDLGGLPPLSTWPEIEHVVVWNSDAAATRGLAKEIRRMPPRDGYRSASKGRDAAWFATEYGLPFSGWPAKTARVAVKAFAGAAKRVGGAATADDALAAVEDFVHAANTLPGIATAERDDLGEAVLLLARLSEALHPDVALARFDAVREF